YGRRGPHGWNSQAVEGVANVALEIAPVLDADRNPDQAVGDPRQLEVLGRQLRVRGRARVAGERLHAAETDGVAQAVQPAQDGAGATQVRDQLFVARQDDAGQEVAEAVQVLRSRVDHQVGVQRQRVLEGGSHEGVVDRDQRGVGVAARRRDRPADVDHAEGRV